MTSIFDSDEFNDRLFFPRRDATPPPTGADELFAGVPDGRIHLRRHPAGATVCTVLLFHGNGEVVADYDGAAEHFAAAGARLVVADYRGYGRSEGTPTLRNTIADGPLVAAALPPDPARPLIIMGRSLGSVPVAPLYASPPAGTIGFIWESGVGELRGLLERRAMAVQRFTDEERATFDPMDKLRRGRAPILFLHGERDQVIEPREAKAAYDAAGTEHKHLVLVPGRGHNDVMGAELYWQAIAAFVQELRGG